MRAAVVFSLALLLTGCIEPGGRTGWAPLPCDNPDSTSRSLVQGRVPEGVSNYELARRLSTALQDPLTGDPHIQPLGGWKTQFGVILTPPYVGDSGTLLTYEAHRGWPGGSESSGKDALRLIADDLRFPKPYEIRYRADGGEGTIWQTAAQSMEVAGTSSLLTWVPRDENGQPFVRFVWRGFVDLPHGDPLPERDAREVASEFSRCLMDRHGRTEAAGYAFIEAKSLWPILNDLNGSLHYTIHVRHEHPRPGACPSAETEPLVYVDAWTGAVLRYDWNACGQRAA